MLRGCGTSWAQEARVRVSHPSDPIAPAAPTPAAPRRNERLDILSRIPSPPPGLIDV
jgi:hypothetical protein